MAGTPSQTFSLGADALEQLGDLAGAAKALSNEAKSAQKNVRDAQREFKELERQQKINEREAKKLQVTSRGLTGEQKEQAEKEIAKLLDSTKADAAFQRVFAEQRKVDEKKQKADDLKEQARLKSEFQKEFSDKQTVFEKRVSSKVFKVKDSLDSVAKTLMSGERGAAAQVAGKAISGVSAKITDQTVGSLAGALGPAGMAVAGIAAGAFIGDKVAQAGINFYKKRAEAANISSSISSDIFNRVRGFHGRELPADELAMLTTLQSNTKAQAQAITKRGKLGLTGESLLGQVLDIDVSQSKIERQIADNALRVEDVRERFGDELANRIDIDALSKTKTVTGLIRRELASQGGMTRLISDFTRGLGMIAGEDVGAGARTLSKIEQDEVVARRIAEGIAKRTVQAEEMKRQAERLKSIENPEVVAERHSRATRFSGLERQRIRRQMSWASI